MATILSRVHAMVQDAPGLTAKEYTVLGEFEKAHMAQAALSKLKITGYVRAEGSKPARYFPVKHYEAAVANSPKRKQEPEGLVVEHFVRITFHEKSFDLPADLYAALLK